MLADLCAVLDIANPRNASARLAPDMKGVRPMDTPGGSQNLTVVSEAGMYEVVIRSDKPDAVRFRRWITSDVLPTIRKTEAHGAPQLSGEAWRGLYADGARRYGVPMLHNFLYLDEAALAQYVSGLEGGALTEATNKKMTGRAGEGAVSISPVSAKAGGSSAREESQTRTDTPASMFKRLLAAAKSDPEQVGWIDVLNPQVDLADVGIGAMISWECDVYIPDSVRTLMSAGGAGGELDKMLRLMPQARTLGLSMEGLPGEDELRAMSEFIENLGSKTVIIGEDEDDEDAIGWKVSGSLVGDVNAAELDGRAIVVGKVAQVLQPGHVKPFVTLPGMNMLPRAERRKAERSRPEPGKEADFLQGPAVVLDVLAVYR